jgi:phenylacetate-coenzyme A ligase PaaK-like adenylate-forming protein
MYPPWLPWDLWLAGRLSPAALGARREQRLQDLVAHARTRSPAYAQRTRGLPDGPVALGRLPVTDKAEVMAAFGDWVTAPDLSRAEVEDFAARPERIGKLLRGRYAVWKTSGTSGDIGLFLHDPFALAVYDSLFAVRGWPEAVGGSAGARIAGRGGRMACVLAREDHYAGISSWRHQAFAYPWLAPWMRDFSVMTPLAQLVEQLNAWDPVQLVAYPSVLALLADAQAAGRLRLNLAFAVAGGETLEPETRQRIEAAFDCRVTDVYACSECDYIAFGCRHGWLHQNADWTILEPVEADGTPTPPGRPSHSALLTNLANRVQPILRYDLKDSVTVKPEPCPCGSPLPAIRVEGRHDATLLLPGADGGTVKILSLALGTVLEAIAGVRQFQVLQTDGRTLRLRLATAPGRAAGAVGPAAVRAVETYLAGQGVAGVTVALDDAAPQPEPGSGKLRHVIRLASD